MTEERMNRARRIRELRERDRQDTESDGEDENRATDEDATGGTVDEDATGGTVDEDATGGTVDEEAADETVDEEAADETVDEEAADETVDENGTGGQTASDSGDEGDAGENSATQEGATADREETTEADTDRATEKGTDSTRATEKGADETGSEDEAVVPSADSSSGIHAPLPEADELEAALGVSADETETKTAAQDVESGEENETQVETRVLEFTLEDEYYCLDIEYIEEIVKDETITRVPNTPAFVEGVVDLRGQITTILNPKVSLGKENQEPGELIIVFDSEAFDDQGYIGWVVDDVRQVSLITDADVNQPPLQEDYINGVIDSDENGEFVIWTTPDLALTGAE